MLVSPLHRHHEVAGARFLEWGGWRLPAAYSSPADELSRVRTSAGYTDLCFLSHIVVSGPEAFSTLQRLCSRNLERCPTGRAVYTLALNDEGAIVDNGIVFHLADDLFIVSVPSRNATLLSEPPGFVALKQPKHWLRPLPGAQVCIHELGALLIAVQGPRSRDLLRPAVNLDDLPLFSVREARVNDIPVVAARTGYSGELGFEFLVWPESAPDLWEAIAVLAEAQQAAPYGIETIQIIGLEKGYLTATDFYRGSTPLEVGLAWAVDLDKTDFVGRSAVLRRRDEGSRTRLVGLELPLDAPPPAPGDPVSIGGDGVGAITNAAVSPRLELTLARAWLPLEMAVPGTEVEVLTAGTAGRARVCPRFCWYDPEGRRMRG